MMLPYVSSTLTVVLQEKFPVNLGCIHEPSYLPGGLRPERLKKSEVRSCVIRADSNNDDAEKAKEGYRNMGRL